MARPLPLIALLLAAGAGGFFVGLRIGPAVRGSREASTSLPAEASEGLLPEERNAVALFDRTSRSVVFVAAGQERSVAPRAGNVGVEPKSGAEKPAKNAAATPRDAPVDADSDLGENDLAWDSGSGFVWDEEGHVVTNFHVVEGARRIVVRLPDLSDWDATLVGFDPDKDLAVLRIGAPRDRLHPLERGSSGRVRVGQRAYAIGNPYGLSTTLTEGMVSAVGRTIRSGTGLGRIIQDVIQVDAAIHPGNSGGPLLDSAGRLIGVTTATVAENGAPSGIGFAVPVDTVNRIVPDLIEFGRPLRAGLGVRVQTEVENRIRGVMIAYVLPGSAADRAGLRGGMDPNARRFGLGDVITALDGVPVESFDDLYALLDRRRPGDRVRVTYLRKGREYTTEVELQLLPGEAPQRRSRR